jgi:serine/threonine protein kinase
MHGDLSSSNVLLSADPFDPNIGVSGAVAKVADFGLSRRLCDGTSEPPVLSANIFYAAPEILRASLEHETKTRALQASNQDQCAPKSLLPADVYSFAIVVVEVFSAGRAIDVDLTPIRSEGSANRGEQRSRVDCMRPTSGDDLIRMVLDSTLGERRHGGGLRPRIPEHCPPSLAALLPAMWHTAASVRPQVIDGGRIFKAFESSMGGGGDCK